jgi:DNA repair protein RecO (recombination protein O)
VRGDGCRANLNLMAVVRDHAVLLRRHPYGESSLVVHVLTREHGRVALLAKGAYRPTSRYFGVLDFGATLELEYSRAPRSELGLLRAGAVLRTRRGLERELERWRAACGAWELVESLARDDDADPLLYDLLEATLDELARSDTPWRTHTRFVLHVLEHAGLSPALSTCAMCGGAAPAYTTGRAWFSAGAGGRLCTRCAQAARASGRRVGTLPLAVLDDARALLSGADDARQANWTAARTDLVRDFVGRFLDYHLETRLKSQRAFLAAPNRNAPAVR